MTTILCIVFFFSGASALIFEMLWFHLAGITFGNSVWATAIVLSSFMGGLALGNGLAALLGHRIKSPIRLYAFIEITIAISGFALVLLFPNLTELLSPMFRIFRDQAVILNAMRGIIAIFLMLAPATAMGATLPVLVKALYSEKPNYGTVLGILYGWNTLGAMVGVLCGEVYFIEWFGVTRSGLVAVTFNLIAAAVAIRLSVIRRGTQDDHTRAKGTATLFPFSHNTKRFLFAGFSREIFIVVTVLP